MVPPPETAAPPGKAEVVIAREGRAGVIRLDRPDALNALTWAMCRAIDKALRAWRDDPAVHLVLIEGTGPRAFCAGGDIAEMYATGMAGDYTYGRRFWRDEYRMNARIGAYPKPVVSWLHGYVMGGGVGVGCHGSHRLVTEDSKVAMPECGIGLVPDVGGSYLLARAPGRLGEYLGLSGARMGPADAILAGFADSFVPGADWPALRKGLIEGGDAGLVAGAARQAPPGRLAALRPEIDAAFGAGDLAAIRAALAASATDFARETLDALARPAPLSMAAALALLAMVRKVPDLRAALELEYRVTSRAMEHADFLEGIRARIIDKDQSPHWRHAGAEVPKSEVAALLAPLGENKLTFEEETP